MKRILVLLLALAMILTVFAACKKTPAVEPTEPVVNPDDYTTEAPAETEPIELPNADDDVTEPPEEITTEEPATTLPGETTTVAPAADPTTMNKEELIKYYNDAINKVRSDKPGYTRTEVLKVNDFKTNIAGGIADGLIKPIVKNMMPGDPEESKKNKGESNVDHFYHPQQTSAVKASDVASYSAKKEGANYVITLTLGKEDNPVPNGQSKYSRMMFIQTRQQVLDQLAGGGLTGDANNVVMTYRDGKSTITVNEKGQIIKASCGFFVDVTGKNMKISIFNPDIDAFQQSNWEYTGFTW